MTLGALIQQLASCAPNADVRFDFCGFVPKGLASYRGYYDQLALGYANCQDERTTVEKLLTELRGAVGKTFHGYKGGNYKMTLETEVWVSPYNEASGTRIDHVIVEGDYLVILATRYDRY